MQVKFAKNYLSYKKDAVETIEDADVAADLVSKGVAVEVKEDASVDSIVKELEAKIEAKIEDGLAKAVEKVAKSFSGKRSSLVVGADNEDLDPKQGFKSVGEWAKSCRAHATNGESNETFKRYMKTAAAHTVGTDADGGYAVPQIWANEIFTDIQSGDNLLGRTTQYNMTVGDILNIPADGTTTIGTGMSATWTTEGTAMSPAKSILRIITLQPYKLGLLTASTEELERDAQSLSTYLMSQASYYLSYAVNNAIVRGNGSSKPTGWIGYGGTALQGRETSNSVTFKDLGRMYARFYGDTRKACWVANREVFPLLTQMTSGNYNVFLTNSSIEGAPVSTIFGIPVVISEHASTLGSDGDLSLVDLSKYLTAVKGGVDAASSIHLYFNTADNAYRWLFRMDGKPSRATVLTPASGQGGSTKTLSPFVVLDDATCTV